MPEPPVCSMVSVYSTTLPHLSATVRLVVEMFSVSASVVPFARRRRAHAVVRRHVTRGDRLGRRLGRVERAGALGGERVVEQPLGRDVDVGRVADVLRRGRRRRARSPRGSGAAPASGVIADEVVALQDVERLADGGAAGGRRRHAVDVVAAVADLRRALRAHLVVAQVARRQVARRHRQLGVLRGARLADDVGHQPRERTAVERLRALLARSAVGRGEVGVAEDRADLRGRRPREEQLLGVLEGARSAPRCRGSAGGRSRRP